MWIRALLSTIVELFYDDDLLAGLATLKDDCNLSIPLKHLMIYTWKDDQYLSCLVD